MTNNKKKKITNKIGTGDQAKEFLFSIFYKYYIYIIYLDTIRKFNVLFIRCFAS